MSAKPPKTPIAKRKVIAGPDQYQIRAFVREFLHRFSATKAAIAAGYSKSHAPKAGVAILQMGVVQELMQELALEEAAAANVRNVDILRSLMQIGYSNIADLFRAGAVVRNGRYFISMKSFMALPPSVQQTVASIRIAKRDAGAGDGVQEIVEVKLWDKLRALELLAKHKGLTKDTLDLQLSFKQLESLSDEELLVKHESAVEQWRQHVAARARFAGRAAMVPDAQVADSQER
jgi:phage terminase small subunit